MNCKAARRRLSPYMDGELPAPQRETLAAHLAQCADCAAQLERHRRLWEALGRAPKVEPSTGFRAAVRTRVAEWAGAHSRRPSWAATLRPMYWAAAFALALAAGIALGRDLAPQPDPSPAPPALLSTWSAEPFSSGPDGSLGAAYLEIAANPGGG